MKNYSSIHQHVLSLKSHEITDIFAKDKEIGVLQRVFQTWQLCFHKDKNKLKQMTESNLFLPHEKVAVELTSTYPQHCSDIEYLNLSVTFQVKQK